MTVVSISEATRRQNDLFGEFLRAREAFEQQAATAIVPYSKAYKACIDDGMEMASHVKPDFGRVLLLIATGKLLPKKAFTFVPLATRLIEHVATLSHDEQEDVLKSGVPVRRNGKLQRIQLGNAKTTEVIEAIKIDKATGKGRLVEPKEKPKAKRRRRNDKKEITFKLDYAVYDELRARMKRERMAENVIIVAAIRKYLDIDD